jgi:hypothetical protein
LLIVGEAITNIHIAFEHPRWRFLYDDDGQQAIRTRVQLLERAASEVSWYRDTTSRFRRSVLCSATATHIVGCLMAWAEEEAAVACPRP